MGRVLTVCHELAFNNPLGWGQIAQSVEQRTENPRVAGSIPALATIPTLSLRSNFLCSA